MCGIVGFVGGNKENVFDVLRTGLLGLEYRGYDSGGIALIDGDHFLVRKCLGGPGNLHNELSHASRIGIGHTRWATHGGVTLENAHPHFDDNERVALVHNGTIENFATLRKSLQAQGHVFRSETDTEVLAYLVGDEMKHADSLEEAVEQALSHIIGAYGVAVISLDQPDVIIAARKGSPLLLGVGPEFAMVASDQNAIASFCSRVVYLDENEIATITPGGYRVRHIGGDEVHKEDNPLEVDLAEQDKGAHPHFMIKEILEQPERLRDGMSGRLNAEGGLAVLGGIRDHVDRIAQATSIIVTGCGTAYYAALTAQHVFEQLLHVPVRAVVASELLYRKVNEPPDSTVVFFISQSGETADTKEVLNELRRRGYLTIGIVNSAGSSIARDTDAGVYIRAGVERAVASTKAFTSQLLALTLVCVALARKTGMSKLEGQDIIGELHRLPTLLDQWLPRLREEVAEIAQWLHARTPTGLFFMGRKYSYPVALEAALKVKEITYIMTEGYPSGEMKHGSIALVDTHYHAFVIAPEANLFDQAGNTVHEIKSRGGSVVLVTSESLKDHELCSFVDKTIFVPNLKFNFLSPFVSVIPFQLLAYELASLMGREIDKPRNLAKSVTVQ